METLHIILIPAVYRGASMEPYHFRYGNQAASNTSKAFNRPRFNGAIPFQVWKRLSKAAALYCSGTLQWSHTISGMETRGSIGEASCIDMLQWSHTISGMETASIIYNKEKCINNLWYKIIFCCNFIFINIDNPNFKQFNHLPTLIKVLIVTHVFPLY